MNYISGFVSKADALCKMAGLGFAIQGVRDICSGQVVSGAKEVLGGLTLIKLQETLSGQIGWIGSTVTAGVQQGRRMQGALLSGAGVVATEGAYDAVSAYRGGNAFRAIQSACRSALGFAGAVAIASVDSQIVDLAYQTMLFTCISAQTIGSGITDLKNKKIALGSSKILLGSAGMLGVGSLAYSLFAEEGRPVQIAAEKPQPKDPEICIFTSYTTDDPERLKMSRFVAKNHQEYAKAQGYDYRVFEENLAPGSLPYWSKIGGTIKYLNGEVSSCPNPKWVVWLDDDALFTNPNIRVEEVITDHTPHFSLRALGLASEPHVIVTKDAVSDLGWTTSLNTGVLFARNSEESREVMGKLYEMRFDPAYNCPEQKGCLHEQEAFHDLLQGEPMDAVEIIEQRGHRFGINTFERYNHFDDKRDMYLDYSSDPWRNRFHKGDFIAQCTGMAVEGHTWGDERVRNLRRECIEELQKKALPLSDY